jgi:hypothetical protein
VYSEQGQEKIMHIFYPGDAFGGLLLGTAHGEVPWAQAMDEVIVSYMDESAFKRFMQTFPDLCMNIFRYMADHHADDMRRMGQVIAGHIPEKARPTMPPPPKSVKVFQLGTLMGIMILLIVLIIGIVLAVGVVPTYWNHSVANELNPAQLGSALLAQLSVISSFGFWLNPLRMLGMAFLFTGITVALTVIIGVLRQQAGMLVNFYQQATRQ